MKSPVQKEAVQEKGSRTPNQSEVITTHINADFDALASMLAAKKLYPDATLVFPGSQEKNLRNFFLHSASYVFNFARLKQIDLNKVQKLILVDTRQQSRIGKFQELVGRDGLEIHIYDHHPDSDEDVRGDLEVIEEVGATTSIITGIIREKGLTITPDEATIMCLGIHEDTGSFQFPSTRPEDFQAAAWLTVKVCPAMVMDPLREDPVLGSTVYLTVPLPVPLLPLLISIHELLLDAVQPQPVPVVTSTFPVSPPDPTLSLVGEIE